jgi:hypothetical protein
VTIILSPGFLNAVPVSAGEGRVQPVVVHDVGVAQDGEDAPGRVVVEDDHVVEGV